MAETAHVAQGRPWASIEIHNNTGPNPRYACVNKLDPATLQLARPFSSIVVYFVRPVGRDVALCPSNTVECGKAGRTLGGAHAAALVEAAQLRVLLPDHPPRPEDLAVYHAIATVRAASVDPFPSASRPRRSSSTPTSSAGTSATWTRAIPGRRSARQVAHST